MIFQGVLLNYGILEGLGGSQPSPVDETPL